jgi:hypothetical protein
MFKPSGFQLLVENVVESLVKDWGKLGQLLEISRDFHRISQQKKWKDGNNASGKHAH